MSNNTIDPTVASTDLDVDVPDGWEVLPPPPGIALLAIDGAPDHEDSTFQSNLVVTMQPRTTIGVPTSGEVDDYLTTLLATLDEQLDDVEELGVWTADDRPDAPERLATQRVLLGYRIPSADNHVDVEMMQQHIWLADDIVTITATVAAGVDDRIIDTLNVCLDSLSLAP